MTRKHFEWAAEYCREFGKFHQTRLNGVAKAQLVNIVEGYIALFKQFAPRFNETIFRAACEAF